MPSATRAFAVKSSDHRGKGGRLGNRHDGPKCQRGSMGVVSLGDAGYRMTVYLDRRLWNVLVVVSGTGLA